MAAGERSTLGHIPELDGLRGCAALAVFVLHLFNTVSQRPHQQIPPAVVPFLRFAALGTYGVDAFFVLSGFLITSLLLLDRHRPQHFYRDFYWKRVLRIQPVYVMHLVAVWFLIPDSHGYVLLALIFLVNFDTLFHVPDVGPAWTLSIEEQFYLVWPQVIRRTSVETVYKVATGLVLGSVGARLFATLVLGHMSTRYTFYRLDGLGLGALLALQWIGAQPAWKRAGLLTGALNSRVILGMAVAYGLWSALFPMRSLNAITLFAVNLLVYRLIRYILLCPQAASLAWLRSRPMIFLGAISYGLYMFHVVILLEYDKWVGPPTFHLQPLRCEP